MNDGATSTTRHIELVARQWSLPQVLHEDGTRMSIDALSD